eukprot:Gregarina_sp_Poly_1__4941@NODE_261_length_10458_cov_187_060244_g228_i0_p7_GENE_NODE_261_length_10458_cov_187_060244_g228_i0NODE_261_length_10458_cov_187_060244_g228_i0_p7_ORF_typecomplete_len219_score11_87_NODE_261_length_10458_cov_187_060244_g228_i027423398
MICRKHKGVFFTRKFSEPRIDPVNLNFLKAAAESEDDLYYFRYHPNSVIRNVAAHALIYFEANYVDALRSKFNGINMILNLDSNPMNVLSKSQKRSSILSVSTGTSEVSIPIHEASPTPVFGPEICTLEAVQLSHNPNIGHQLNDVSNSISPSKVLGSWQNFPRRRVRKITRLQHLQRICVDRNIGFRRQYESTRGIIIYCNHLLRVLDILAAERDYC